MTQIFTGLIHHYGSSRTSTIRLGISRVSLTEFGHTQRPIPLNSIFALTINPKICDIKEWTSFFFFFFFQIWQTTLVNQSSIKKCVYSSVLASSILLTVMQVQILSKISRMVLGGRWLITLRAVHKDCIYGYITIWMIL